MPRSVPRWLDWSLRCLTAVGAVVLTVEFVTLDRPSTPRDWLGVLAGAALVVSPALTLLTLRRGRSS